MKKGAYAVLILVLMIPISVYAQNEIEPSLNGSNSDYYLLPGIESGGELWELDSDPLFLELSWIDMDTLCDILLELCLDLEVTDEDMYDIFPDLWEVDYEYYLLWEDDWY